MSRLIASYAPVYSVGLASMDGHLYRADIERHAWTGDWAPLLGVALRISWGADGGASTAEMPLAPVAPATARLTVRDTRSGRLAETVGAPDGAWRLVVRRLTGGPKAGVVYRGYLLAETYEDSPYGASSVVTLGFAGGLGLLEARPFAGAGIEGRDDGGEGPYWAFTGPRVTVAGRRPRSERIARSFGRVLGPLFGNPDDVAQAGDAAGVVATVGWRPWLPGTTVADTTDPLFAVLTQEESWLDADGGTQSQLAALRGLCSRFGARLFQSNGRWHITQRGLLARLRGQGVPRHTYAPSPFAPGVAEASTRSLDDLVVDTRHWPQVGPHAAPTRGVTAAVRSVEVAYDFRPDLDDMLLNASFERAGSSANVPEFWAVYGGAERRAIANSPIPSLDATNLDAWYLSLPPGGSGAIQADRTSLPGSTAWDLDVSWDMAVLNGGAPQPDTATWGELRVERSITEAWYVERVRVRCVQDVLPGKKNRMTVERVAGAVPGAVSGVPVIPEGATLKFNRSKTVNNVVRELLVGTLTTTERVPIGATSIAGEIEIPGTEADQDVRRNMWSGETERIRTDDWADIYVWRPGYPSPSSQASRLSLTGGGWAIDENGAGFDVRYGRVRAYVTGVDVTGTQVSGALTTQFQNTSNNVYVWFVDDVTAAVRIGGDVAGTASARAVLPAGTPGLDVSASRGGLPVGDGPRADSLTALHAEGADGETYPTTQGGNTGWTAGAYAPGDVSTGRSIDLLAAREALRQLAGAVTPDAASGGGLERVRTGYLLRGGATLAPENVVRHWPVASLALTAVPGATTVYLHAAPRVGGTIEIPAGSKDDYGVLNVTRGAGLFAVGIDRPLAPAPPPETEDDPEPAPRPVSAGTRCAYDVLCWWDGFDWDVVAGSVYYDATALDLCDDATFAEEVRLGSS